jgi:hypothetical protein
VIVLAALALSACDKTQDTQQIPPPPPATSSPVVTPVDHLADGELLEGTEKAFGVILPRGVTIVHGFDDLIVATGIPSPERVANYMRQRLKEGKITVGARATVFEKVKTAGAPDLELSVLVEPNGDGCRIEVRKLTTPKAPALPDDEARWRAAGLKPNGQPLDPRKLQ